MAFKKAESNIKKEQELAKKRELLVSDEAQNRLAEILSNAPRIVKFAKTEWEIHPLCFGTQYLICQEICKINKAEEKTYGDIVKQFIHNIPAMASILTLVLLNNKKLIFNNGDDKSGFSKLYKKTLDTVMWDMDVAEFIPILVECMQMVDVSFFLQTLDMLQIFRERVTKKKRTRMETNEVK